MGLQDIVNLQITLKTSAPSKAGFGRPILVGYFPIHANFMGRTKLYKNPDDMLLDGFTTSSKLYKDAVVLFSQNPHPKDFMVGRMATTPVVQTIELTPTVTTQGFVYSGKINGLAFTYTVGAAATIQIIVEALAPIITALAGVTATEDNTKVIVTTDTAGTTFMYTELVPELRVKDATADPGVATDLAAIFAENFDWFGLSLASNSEAEVNAAAAWLETKRRIMSFSTADFGAKDGVSTTDVLSDLKTLNNFNTGGWYHQDVGSQLGLAIMGQRLTSIPGSDTWAHKKVVGVPVSKLSAAEEAAVQAKNGNTYTEIAGNGNTFPGKVASGEYFDIVRYVHFLFARIQERVIFVFQNNEKIAYTDAGIALLAGAVQAILISHTKKPYNALSTNPLPVTTAPAEADIDPADKINRVLPGVEFSAKLAGAIHAVEINGTLTA